MNTAHGQKFRDDPTFYEQMLMIQPQKLWVITHILIWPQEPPTAPRGSALSSADHRAACIVETTDTRNAPSDASCGYGSLVWIFSPVLDRASRRWWKSPSSTAPGFQHVQLTMWLSMQRNRQLAALSACPRVWSTIVSDVAWPRALPGRVANKSQTRGQGRRAGVVNLLRKGQLRTTRPLQPLVTQIYHLFTHNQPCCYSDYDGQRPVHGAARATSDHTAGGPRPHRTTAHRWRCSAVCALASGWHAHVAEVGRVLVVWA